MNVQKFVELSVLQQLNDRLKGQQLRSVVFITLALESVQSSHHLIYICKKRKANLLSDSPEHETRQVVLTFNINIFNPVNDLKMATLSPCLPGLTYVKWEGGQSLSVPSGNLKKGNLGPENAFLSFLPLLSSNLVIEMQKNATENLTHISLSLIESQTFFAITGST